MPPKEFDHVEVVFRRVGFVGVERSGYGPGRAEQDDRLLPGRLLLLRRRLRLHRLRLLRGGLPVRGLRLRVLRPVTR